MPESNNWDAFAFYILQAVPAGYEGTVYIFIKHAFLMTEVVHSSEFVVAGEGLSAAWGNVIHSQNVPVLEDILDPDSIGFARPLTNYRYNTCSWNAAYPSRAHISANDLSIKHEQEVLDAQDWAEDLIDKSMQRISQARDALAAARALVKEFNTPSYRQVLSAFDPEEVEEYEAEDPDLFS